MRNILLGTFILMSLCTYAQLSERLIARTTFNALGQPVLQPFDSTVFLYSGLRKLDSSWSLFPPQSYDIRIQMRYSSGYIPYRKSIRTWDANNKMLTDTLYGWSSSINDYMPGEVDLFTYDPDGHPDRNTSKFWSSTMFAWINLNQTPYSFDGSGNMVARATIGWNYNTSTWDTTFADYWNYNQANQITSYTDKRFDSGHPYSSYRTKYTYNAAGKIDSIISGDLLAGGRLLPKTVSIDSYALNGDLAFQTIQLWDSSGWHYANKTFYTFDGHQNLIQSVQQNYDTVSGQWYNNRLNEFIIDSEDMVTQSSMSAWDTAGTGSWKDPYNLIRFYYERYGPAEVSDLSGISNIKIYPLPASQVLSLQYETQEPEPSAATIYDEQGQVVSQYISPPTSEHHAYLPVNSLPVGMYFLDIKTKSGTVTKTFNILR